MPALTEGGWKNRGLEELRAKILRTVASEQSSNTGPLHVPSSTAVTGLVKCSPSHDSDALSKSSGRHPCANRLALSHRSALPFCRLGAISYAPFLAMTMEVEPRPFVMIPSGTLVETREVGRSWFSGRMPVFQQAARSRPFAGTAELI